ncbi:haloacid dehalogenase [Candidatus Bathyarchaeota archaeon]|nr:haloacid dehalogenase [Candidatus Bathyarchaeota archaeon]
MASLKSILRNIRREIKEFSKMRENVQADIRKAASLSKQAILQVHRRKMNEAQKLLEKAGEIIRKMTQFAKENPDIVHGGMFNAALQEYAEACILVKLIKESSFASPEEIGVPPIDYTLGLADVIGECRRVALDSLREGDVEKSESFLQLMEEIYLELLSLDDAFMLVPGLRRKCDVARRIIEATRGDVTLEVRRQKLEKHLERIERLQKEYSLKQ